MDANVRSDDEPVPVLNWKLPLRMRAETDQWTQLALFAAGTTGELARMRPLDDVLRSASAADPDVAAARRLQNDVQRHEAMTTVVGWIRTRAPLLDGLDVTTAADVVWTLTSPEVHQYTTWLQHTLERFLLPEASPGR